MLVHNSGALTKGILLAVTFLIVLVLMFLPLFEGENALKAADRLFNSISKYSSQFIPTLQEKVNAFMGVDVNVNLKLKSGDMAQRAARILGSAGATATAEGEKVKVNGDLGKVLTSALNDSYAMYFNNDSELQSRYGFEGKEVLYVWWNILKEFDKDLKKQGKFKAASFVSEVIKRGVEVSFNYFGIKPKSARDNAFILTASLIFYVIYTLWWGIAILYIFEGIGLEMKAGHKKEV